MARCREGWQRRVKPSASTFLGIEEAEFQVFFEVPNFRQIST
jgi:hypothetical protein